MDFTTCPLAVSEWLLLKWRSDPVSDCMLPVYPTTVRCSARGLAGLLPPFIPNGSARSRLLLRELAFRLPGWGWRSAIDSW